MPNDNSAHTQAPEFDMYMPLPGKEMELDRCTILTHYFGFSIPEENIGAFIYSRCQPAFPLSQGGVGIFRGSDNIDFLDMEYSDYSNTMFWPEVGAKTIQYSNGMRVEFLELGTKVRITYKSPDGRTSIDIIQTAVTPLLARGHVVPGEDLFKDAIKLQTGGLEQMMHCTGELNLEGKHYDIDCFNARDRSWGQIRPEAKRAVSAPPVGWSPMYFSKDFIFNQVSFEALDTNPPWRDLYQIPETAPTHHFAWLSINGEMIKITRIRREVSKHHPLLQVAMEQTVEAEDENGKIYRFRGKAISMANMPAWPNASLRVGVYKWTNEQGQVAYDTYQEMWLDDAPQKAMRNALKNGSWT